MLNVTMAIYWKILLGKTALEGEGKLTVRSFLN